MDNIVKQQGWDKETVIELLTAFIYDHIRKGEELEAFLRTVANAESLKKVSESQTKTLTDNRNLLSYK